MVGTEMNWWKDRKREDILMKASSHDNVKVIKNFYPQ